MWPRYSPHAVIWSTDRVPVIPPLAPSISISTPVSVLISGFTRRPRGPHRTRACGSSAGENSGGARNPIVVACVLRAVPVPRNSGIAARKQQVRWRAPGSPVPVPKSSAAPAKQQHHQHHPKLARFQCLLHALCCCITLGCKLCDQFNYRRWTGPCVTGAIGRHHRQQIPLAELTWHPDRNAHMDLCEMPRNRPLGLYTWINTQDWINRSWI